MSYLEHRPDRCKTGADAMAAYEAAKKRRQEFYARPTPVIIQPEPEPIVPNPINEIKPDHPLMQLVAAAQFEVIGGLQRAPTIKDIQRAICFVWDVSLADLLSSRRYKKIFLPRQVGFVLCKLLTTHSFPEIGRRFGGKDHSTVFHAIRKFEWLAAELGLEVAQPLVYVAGRAKQLIEERDAA